MVLFFENPSYPASYLAKYNLTSLDIDEAILNVTSLLDRPLWMYSLSSECHHCPYTKVFEISDRHQKHIVIDTTFKTRWKFYETDRGRLVDEYDNTQYCEIRPTVEQFGIYNVVLDEERVCDFKVEHEGVNILTPLLLIAVIFGLFIAFAQVKNLLKRRRTQSPPTVESAATINTIANGTDEVGIARQNSSSGDDELVVKENPKPRLKSLDTFRGISICLMIFVNSGGGSYSWIEHATWNGLHIADVVFPFFLWIMGVCIPISIKSQIRRNARKNDMVLNVLRRSLTLFAIGVCLNTVAGTKLENLRIFGVLQRFGIAYFCVATLHILMSKPVVIQPQNRLLRLFLDVKILFAQWLVMFGLIILHLVLTFELPVPGCPRGYLGPGGKQDDGLYKNCIGGTTGYVDRLILGINHIYQHPTARYVYDSSAFDPEGVFGCLLTIVHTFFGVQCGVTLITFPDWKERVKRWMAWGFVVGLIGGILCNFSKEDGWIPVNKNMWSLSFVLITTCFAFYLLSICYILIDVRKFWDGSPFFYSGMNAILMYIGHTITHKMLPWHWQIGEMNTHFIRLTECLWNTLLWMAIAYHLYRKKIFYTV